METTNRTVTIRDPLSETIREVVIGVSGATIIKFIVTNGITERNIVLGYDTPEEYLPENRSSSSPYHGATVGRYANRIALGRFSLNGQEYSLATNNGPNALHGGPTGFSERIWSVESEEDSKVVLSYTSEDGEEEYPCKLKAQVTYLIEGSSLKVLHEAWLLDEGEARKTIVNLTNHSYFNLTGEKECMVLDHIL